MPTFRNLVGEKFGRWLVIKHEGRKYGEQFWLCRCECGTERVLIGGTLKTGRSTSCGCYSAERSTTHGMNGTPTYNAWAHMLTRCRNPEHKQWEHYGGRGITVCERWLSFENFLADMGEKPKGKSLDRINNDGNYEPSNCRWATSRQQVTNRRVSPRYKWNGEEKSLADLAEAHGLKWRRVYERIRSGWSLHDALTVKRGSRWNKKGQT